MKTLIISALALASVVAVVGCDKRNEASTTAPTSADNTRTNARDDASAVTAMDQGNNSADLNTTQAIRKAVMADNGLSNDAKNVKIVTANGTVTLRGPVKNDAEKMNVEAKAKANAGSNRVDNQIDIEKK